MARKMSGVPETGVSWGDRRGIEVGRSPLNARPRNER